jgi:hypothetical protein
MTNVHLVWLCKVFVTQIRFFGMYMRDNLVVFMMVGNLSIIFYTNSYILMRFYQS